MKDSEKREQLQFAVNKLERIVKEAVQLKKDMYELKKFINDNMKNYLISVGGPPIAMDMLQRLLELFSGGNLIWMAFFIVCFELMFTDRHYSLNLSDKLKELEKKIYLFGEIFSEIVPDQRMLDAFFDQSDNTS